MCPLKPLESFSPEGGNFEGLDAFRFFLKQHNVGEKPTVMLHTFFSFFFLKKNQSTPRPSEHPPVMGGKLSKRLGGIKGCKYKTSSWHSNRFPDADNIGSTV